MTHNKLCPWLMQYLHCWAYGDALGVVRIAFLATADMTQLTSVTVCVPVTLCLCWRSATPSTAVGWVNGAG